MSQLPESAITMTSALRRSWYFASRAGSVSEPTSSSPSMKSRTVTGQVVAVHPQRADVRHDPGLVVGRAATVEPAVALGRLPRRGVPVGVVVLGLDVVVGVEQHGRRARRALLLADHRRRRAVEGAHDLDLDALGREQRGRGLARSARPRRAAPGSALTDSIRTRSSRSLRTPGRTAWTRARMSSLMALNLTGG